MGARGISGVPVIDKNGQVTGIISEKDFLTRMGGTGNQNFMTLVANCLKTKGCVALPIKNQLAEEIMTSPAITVTPSTSAKEISALFASRRVNRLPVVDADGKIQGIITRGYLHHVACQGERT
jgi:CBS domain-containing protein